MAGRTFDYGPARRKSVPPTVTPPWIPVSTGKTREVVVVPHPDAVPMGHGRARLHLPIRRTAPRCGTHGGVRVAGRTFDYGPARRKSVPLTITPPWIPVSTGKTREIVVVPYPDAIHMGQGRARLHLPIRRTAPRCGTHGGVGVAGRTFDYGPARRKSVPPTVTPPWIPVSTGKTREVVVVPHPDAIPMGQGRARLHLPIRRTAPRCGTHGGVGVAGRTFDYGPARRKNVPPTVTPPWIPVSTGKTREVVVVPYPDVVPTGHGRARLHLPIRLTALRCGTHGGVKVAGRTFDYGPARRKSVPPTVTPPWIPVSTGKTKGKVPAPTTFITSCAPYVIPASSAGQAPSVAEGSEPSFSQPRSSPYCVTHSTPFISSRLNPALWLSAA